MEGKRQILIAVLGLTPQIVTETLYYLTQVRRPPVVPEEIHVLTTSRGRERIVEALLGKGGWFFRFCREYRIDPGSMGFDEGRVLVLRDPDGHPLEDIRTARENELAADQIIDFVRRMAQDPGVVLYCSAAGGRKTMGIYLAYALTLFGRPQDVLFHVLVSEEFETHPEFFYKPRVDRVLEVKGSDGRARSVSTGQVRIDLAEIPYVRLRDKLEGLFDPRLSYGQMVARAQREVDLAPAIPDLEVDLPNRRLVIGNISVNLPPTLLVIYTHYAKNKLERCPELERGNCRNCISCFETLTETTSRESIEEMIRVYAHLCGGRQPRWQDGFDYHNLRSHFSKINRAIRDALTDPRIDQFFVICNPLRRWADARYGIRLDRSKIKISE